MGKLIRDATPEQEREFIEERRKFAFLAASKLFPLWLRTAERHKRAADILYEVAHAAYERDMERTLKEIHKIRADMSEQGLSSYRKSRKIEGKELQDYLDSELLSEYLLLSGYALECILKGCLIAKHPEFVENDERLNIKVTIHDLKQLCRDCGITLSPLEIQLLDTITWHIEWGKYPVPKEYKKMPSPVEPDKKPLDIPGSPFNQRKVQTLVNDIYNRGCDLFNKLRHSEDLS